jgi:hypothetical protein
VVFENDNIGYLKIISTIMQTINNTVPLMIQNNNIDDSDSESIDYKHKGVSILHLDKDQFGELLFPAFNILIP